MDKHQELNELLKQVEQVIKSADKSTYTEHWEVVQEHIRRASFIVWNFDRDIENLNNQLDRQQAGARAFQKYISNIKPLKL